MEEPKPTPRIFISHAETEALFVAWLADALTALGHTLWLNHDALVGGAQPFEQIHQALEESQVMLLVITPAAVKSHLVNRQWMYFLRNSEKTLIPILLEPLLPPDKINFMLAELEQVDFSQGDHPAAINTLHQRLLEAYEAAAGGQEARRDAIPLSYRTPARAPASSEPALKDTGLVSVHMGMPLSAYAGWLRQASQTVRVLNTWTGIFVDYADLLVDTLRRGVNVQILLLHPSSPFAYQRTRDLYLNAAHPALDENEVPRNIRASIRQVAYLYLEAQGQPGKLELRLYNVLPSFSIHQCDSTALIGFFPHALRTTTFPMLEVNLRSPLGQPIDDEFTHIWNSATSVDLLRRFAPETETANQALPEPLSARELEILELISTGLSNQEIANQLVVTVATIKKHINSVYGKLNVTSRTRAILRAQELGLARAARRASP